MVSTSRALEIAEYVNNKGIEDTAKAFNISTESVFRYLRTAKNATATKDVAIPKVLMFDLETAPMLGSIWGLWKQNVDAIRQLERDWFIICYSAKWLGSDEIVNACVTPEQIKDGDDSDVVSDLWNLLNEADVVIAHNLIKFDRKRANTRFLMNGMPPPSPYRLIDTLAQVKKEFAFASNRMDFINKALGLERKIDTGGMQLWTDCLKGDEDALERMQTYCDQDIAALESTYFAIAPWIRSNINFGVYNDVEIEQCTHCGSTSIYDTGKFQTTNTSRFRLYRCGDCKGWSRNRHTELTVNKRKSLLTSTPL